MLALNKERGRDLTQCAERRDERGGGAAYCGQGIVRVLQGARRALLLPQAGDHRDVAGEHEERDGKLSGSRGAGYVVCIEPFHVDGSQDYFQDGMGGVQREGGVIERAVKGKLVNSERLRVKRGKEGF